MPKFLIQSFAAEVPAHCQRKRKKSVGVYSHLIRHLYEIWVQENIMVVLFPKNDCVNFFILFHEGSILQRHQPPIRKGKWKIT